MHLKQLKLAGFKSFVDPAIVYFPSQLVAVVGPNGCGKSNIIDAVRWVLGESSARNLRGEAMVDVIFNGAANRKPIGQASVELIFDNSLGRLAGPFTSYGEIAVKRVVTRAGDSSYYLNGTRCRRKDITDIFLGTGAGARGYSIIGQGTISSLVEAKPEELRVFIEEAAGVSKYKERRRETLQRITHTYENLIRVTDIQEELSKQVQRLKEQAEVATIYRQLKEKEKLYQAQILALKWQELNQQTLEKQRIVQDLSLHYEQQQASLATAHKERVILNEQLQEENEHLQKIQAEFYKTASKITYLEETIQQQIKEKKRLEQEKQQAQQEIQAALAQLHYDKEQLLASQSKAEDIATQLYSLHADFKASLSLLADKKNQQTVCEERWQEVQEIYHATCREFDRAQFELYHAEQKKQAITLQLERLNKEQAKEAVEQLQKKRKIILSCQQELKVAAESSAMQLHLITKAVTLLRKDLQDTEQSLHQLQDTFYLLNSEHAALLAAQQAVGKNNKKALESPGLCMAKPKLVEVLQVEAAWQTACDMILADALHAYVIEDFTSLGPLWPEYEKQGEDILIMQKPQAQNISVAPPRLVDKVQGLIPATLPKLEHIITANTIEEAISWLPYILDYESIVTIEGVWLGKGWLKLGNTKEHDKLGMLARQQQIGILAKKIKKVQHQIEKTKAQRDRYYQNLKQNLADLECLQSNNNATNQALRENINALSNIEKSIQAAEKQEKYLADTCEELHYSLEETTALLMQKTQQCTLLEQQVKDYKQQQISITQEKKIGLDILISQNKHIEHLRTLVHQMELEADREHSKIQQLNERIVREQERVAIAQHRAEQMALVYLNAITPEDNLQKQLTEQVAKYNEIQLFMITNQEQLTQVKATLKKLEHTIIKYGAEVKKAQDTISHTQMHAQELAVRAGTVQESLEALGLDKQLVLKEVPKDTTQNICEKELVSVVEKIKDLGAINLAAIEEYNQEQQRKIYLDKQHEDLNDALKALKVAIEQMDKETQIRIKHTFDAVNAAFKVLFPKLFGGGRAQLELTCDNLLETGIVVMAQPPGKRNSTIHLLSGGEKAMTAVALVFAIFQLNPSPFCMLDEVDAPLDEANVGRFCDLVKEMSQCVQFLFITHNKVTMELADHLIGVTMREPGVSRLVTVDVQHALIEE